MEKVELRTERLLLRPWRLSDLEDAWEYGSDLEWRRYLFEVPEPYTRAEAEAFVRMASGPWDERTYFALELDGKVIGGMNAHVMDAALKLGGLGYSLARPHWGRGYGSEGARAVLDFGFEAFGFHKVIARIDSRNEPSRNLARKLGMQQEALLRKHRFVRGEWMDEVWYAILREEWEAHPT